MRIHSLAIRLVLLLSLLLPATVQPAIAAIPFALPQQINEYPDVQNTLNDIRSKEPESSDDFSADNSTWETIYDGDTSRYFKAGEYHVSVDAPDLIAWGLSSLEGQNFFVEVDSRYVAGPLENEFGIIFRYVDTNNFYLFAIGNDGYYTLVKLEDDEWFTIIEWTESDAIEVGETGQNLLGVLANGTTLSLVINNIVIDQVEDGSFESGRIGLGVGTFDEDGTDIAFDDFGFWTLEQTRAPTRPSIGTPNRPGTNPTPTPLPSPTPIPTPTATPAPTATPVEEIPLASPTPTATAVSSLPVDDIDAIRATAPTYSDDFSQDIDTFAIESTEQATYTYIDEELQVRVNENESLSWSFSESSWSDYLVEIDVIHVEGPTNTEYGLIFRYIDGQNLYFYAITATGYYSLWKRVADQWELLHDWTETSILATGDGAVNRLGVLAMGEEITLYANGEEVTSVADSSFSRGRMGIAVGTFDESPATIGFDNLDIWDLTSDDTDATSATDSRIGIEEPVEPDLPAGEQSAEQRLATVRAQEPLFTDDFGRDTGVWSGTSDDNATYTFQRRTLQIQVNQPDWNAWSLHEDNLSDFLFEGDVQIGEGAEDGAYGFIFRLIDVDNYYIFRYSLFGNYSLGKVEAGEWVSLIDWADSTFVDTSDGAINRLSVLAEGDAIALAINGNIVAEVTDGSFGDGAVGLVTTAYTEPGAVAAFDNVSMWDLAGE